MTPARHALSDGFARVRRYWPLFALLVLLHVCGALALALPGRDVLSTLSNRPDVWSADGGVPPQIIVEMLRWEQNSGRALAPQDDPINGVSILIALSALLVTTVLAGLVLTPGLILTYHEAPNALDWRRVGWAAGHWWTTFLALTLIEALFTLLLLIVTLVFVGLAGALGGGAAALFTGGVLAWLAATLFGGLGEYARIAAVAQGRRSPLACLALAWGRLRARPAPLMGVYLLGPAFTLAILWLYLSLIGPAAVLAPAAVMIAVQQVFVLVRLLARQWRLASEVALVG
jgi:hypothetical protein